MSTTSMLPLSKLALISKEDLATVTIPGEDFHGHYCTRKMGGTETIYVT
jgi:hypothetical protein